MDGGVCKWRQVPVLGNCQSSRRQLVLPAVIALVALMLLASASYTHLKALLGQYLIREAWQQTVATAAPSKPWDWADTWPVAQLLVPALNIDQIVLAGDSGQSLAFGPGHNHASAVPGEPGTAVISGHRDTHFHFLQQLRPGDAVVIKNRRGDSVRYRVSHAEVFDTRTAGVSPLPVEPESTAKGLTHRLLLVTCWPFDGVRANTPWRYLVTAIADVASETTAAPLAYR